MEQQQEGDLSWLQDFIRAKFYETCQCLRKETINFCCECSGLPFCEECKNKTHHHHHHNVLRVSKASHHAGINVLIINKLLDVSDIQTYSINGKRIVYISKRQRNNGKASNGKVVSGSKCKICGWSNLSTLFCSIECKVISWASQEEKKTTDSSIDIEQENCSTRKPPLEESYIASSPGSYRKRKRKGYPVRAHL